LLNEYDDYDLPPEKEVIYIGPQPGPQTDFMMTEADIAIYGGAAGGGKSFALLLEPLRHFNNERFGGVIFRRNSTQVRNEGGLWHESQLLYQGLGAHPREAFLEWVFPSGARLKFGHLEHEKSVYDWHGSQIPFIGFDELTHFTERQFFYMLSRNRSTSGVPGYVRATCNPDADSWVRKLIDWYIDEDGYPIQERSGVIRWFIRRDDTLIWGDSREELIEIYGPEEMPKSFTFIPSNVYDNKILIEKDPGYIANLRSLTRVERLRLLGDHRGGNWNIRLSAGELFKREWFPIVNAIPAGFISAIRYWDRAATKPNEKNRNPDWTRGLKLLRYPDNTFIVADMKSLRDSPGAVESLIKNVASHDGRNVKIMSQRDPGSAGVAESEYFVRMLIGYLVEVESISKDKVTRAKPVSAQCEVGNIRILRAPWNEEFLTELENFPDTNFKDDQVDVLSGAFNQLSGGLSILGAL
jgi:predicted phage terminase large subunit-like protein